jgi:hypothetical protein
VLHNNPNIVWKKKEHNNNNDDDDDDDDDDSDDDNIAKKKGKKKVRKYLKWKMQTDVCTSGYNRIFSDLVLLKKQEAYAVHPFSQNA